MKYFDSFKSPVGNIFAIFSGKFLIEMSFKKPHMKKGTMPAAFRRQLEDYFDCRLQEFGQEVRFTEGTEFERQVWNTLMEVPYGETRSYKWLAGKVGSPGGSRAVGQACSKNPIPIVVPCHRIIESTGRIGGYSSGDEIKRRLLEMEYYYSMDRENR